jgi:photosystem II stability/assembly factor-like uncharacterized protein
VQRGRKGAARKIARRRRARVPGGKALARLNMFLLQRGVAPEPAPPPPPVLPGGAGARAAAARPVAASSPADLVAAFHSARRQLAAAAAAVPQAWQPLGPYFMPHGQTYGDGPGSRPPVAGRVSCIAVDPGNPDHILCGSAGGGVWETRDRGRTWAPRTDDQPSLSIGALAYDPSNPQRVYAGTGEGDTARSATTNIRAAGLLVSDDGGTTWAVQPGTTFIGVSFYALVVDRADGTHILAATTNGLYETLDRGATWSRRRSQLTWSVSMHPLVPTNPAAGREVLAGCIDGVFRSTSGGTQWTPVALPGLPSNFQSERFAVCHAPGNGSVAYAVTAGPPNVPDPGDPDEVMPKPYLWRREAFGGPFTAISAPSDLQTGQAWYDWFAAVAPNNPEVLYVGGINVHRGVRQADGSWKWTNISAKTPAGDSIHPDQHAITFGPDDPNVVYIGSDGGLYRSPDGGTTWETLDKGLCITEVEFLAQHPEHEAWLLAGTQDNGTIRYEGQQTWYAVDDGDGGDCAVDSADPYTCYHSYYGPHLEKSTGGGGWNDWQPTTPKALNNEDALFYPPLDVNGKLVVRGATRVWLSRDAGATWTATPLPGQPGFPSALAAAAGGRAYVGTETGQIYRLDRSGTAWTASPLASPAPGGYVSDLLADPTNPNELWCSVNVGGSGAIHRSSDGGTSWTSRSAGLPPNMAVHAIEIDPASTTRLFAGTDVGVFRTDNAGTSWTAFGRGLPNVLVKDLLLHPATRLLRAGTQARGVWEIALDGANMPDVYVYLRDHAADTGRRLPSAVDVPNPFAKGTNLFWWQSPDIKVDASPFRVASRDDLDFDVYSDDRSKEDQGIEFARGLFDERPIRGQMVRVYVQAHNRGSAAARDVAVRVFYAPGSLTWPDLPSAFWTRFPANAVPAGSPWQPVAAHRLIPEIPTGRSIVVGFDWAVPPTVGSAAALLAVVSAANDSLATTMLNVADLVRNSRYCGLRNLAVVNPPPIVGPRSPAVLVDLWPAEAGVSMELDREARSLVEAVVVSRALAPAAKKAGWREIKIGKAQAAQLAYVTDARPELRRQVDLRRAYRPSAAPLDLTALPADREGAQPFLLLLKPKARRGAGSVIVRRGDDLRGGMTIVNLAEK